MDISANCTRAYTSVEWQAIWCHTPRPGSIGREFVNARTLTPHERVREAAEHAESKLYGQGFTLFANGGLPLLKRHREAWTDEILFHSPNTGLGGIYSPVSVEIIVSYRELEGIRVKYSRSCMMVSPFLAGINLGAFEIPRAHILWNVEYSTSREQIASRLLEFALPWLDDIADPVSLEDRVASHSLSWVDDVTGLELVLATGGRNSARRIVDIWFEEPELKTRLLEARAQISHHLGPVYRSEEATLNLGSLCHCFDLWPSFSKRF